MAAAQPISRHCTRRTWLELWQSLTPAVPLHWQHCIVCPAWIPDVRIFCCPHHCPLLSRAGEVGRGGGRVPGISHLCDATERAPWLLPAPWRSEDNDLILTILQERGRAVESMLGAGILPVHPKVVIIHPDVPFRQPRTVQVPVRVLRRTVDQQHASSEHRQPVAACQSPPAAARCHP